MSTLILNPEAQAAGELYDELVDIFNLFAQWFKACVGSNIALEPPILMNVVQSYSYDLDRYRKFHEIEMSDTVRRAAYLAKWMMRFRPVRVLEYSSSEVARQSELTADELFTMFVVSVYLQVDLEEVLSNRLMNIFIYSLRYRSHSEDTFILFFAHLCGLS